jgi:hypothetical protein
MSFTPNDTCLVGNCQFCGQKEDCVFLTILNKLTALEKSTVKTKKA